MSERVGVISRINDEEIVFIGYGRIIGAIDPGNIDCADSKDCVVRILKMDDGTEMMNCECACIPERMAEIMMIECPIRTITPGEFLKLRKIRPVTISLAFSVLKENCMHCIGNETCSMTKRTCSPSNCPLPVQEVKK